ncbi:MAG: acyltransferase [Deltaproteobacteria bacterium]|nr:acyltransferase [Deltaproteobacteria bacterium]
MRLGERKSPRFEDLDALRAMAMILGIFFHAGLSFVAKDIGWAATDVERSSLVDPLIWTSHGFRMHLFFLLAGFFARMIRERRGSWGFVRDRWRRIGRVFVVGSVTLSPAVMLAWVAGRPSPSQGADSLASAFIHAWVPAHLWFLAYLLWMYAIVLFARLGARAWRYFRGRHGAFAGDRGSTEDVIDRLFAWMTTTSIGTLILVAATAMLAMATATTSSVTQSPGVFEGPERSFLPLPQPFLIYGLFFLAGWILHRRPELRCIWSRRARMHLVVAGTLAVVSVVVFGDGVGSPWISSPWADVLRAAFAWTMTLGLTGAFSARFKRALWGRPWAERAYLFYLLHLPIVLFLQRLLEHSRWPGGGVVKYLVIAGGTLVALEGIYRTSICLRRASRAVRRLDERAGAVG